MLPRLRDARKRVPARLRTHFPITQQSEAVQGVWGHGFWEVFGYESDILKLFHRHEKFVLPKVAPGSFASAYHT